MCVDKLAIFAMVFHTRTHATPHGAVGLRIHAVMPRTRGCEIDIAPVTWMLGGEDMIIQGTLIKIGITCVMTHTKKTFGQLEHIVGIARLRALTVIDIAFGIGSRSEVLTTAVPPYGSERLFTTVSQKNLAALA